MSHNPLPKECLLWKRSYEFRNILNFKISDWGYSTYTRPKIKQIENKSLPVAQPEIYQGDDASKKIEKCCCSKKGATQKAHRIMLYILLNIIGLYQSNLLN